MIRCKYLLIMPLTIFIAVAYNFSVHFGEWLKQPLNAVILFVLLFLVPSFFNVLSMAGLLSRDRRLPFYFFTCGVFLSVVYTWGMDNELLIILCSANALLAGCIALFLKRNYHFDEVKELKSLDTPDWIVKSAIKRILKSEVEKRIQDKVNPQVASRISGGVAAGVLTEALSSGQKDLFSDNLIPAAMSIADSHLANFESGNYSVTGSHANDFNPATGLAMTSDYFDAGGDTYGSALNHDSLFSSDNHISGGFDNHSIDHGSSFSSGFDDSRY